MAHAVRSKSEVDLYFTALNMSFLTKSSIR
jgi:hypothetical protein